MGENTILVGLDIHEYVKGLCEKFLAPAPDMNEREKLAFENGVQNVLGLLDQTINELLEEDEDALIVHTPGLEGITDYLSAKEVMKALYPEN